LTCGRVRQTFDVPADRAGETCRCPYCGDLHHVPKPWAAKITRRRNSTAVAAPGGGQAAAACRSAAPFGFAEAASVDFTEARKRKLLICVGVSDR
jgi:hypothetical protein